MARLSIACFAMLISSFGCSEGGADKRVSSSHVRFTDVTTEAGLALESDTFAVAAGDVNADGFPDLAVSLHDRPALFINRQDGTFVSADSIADFKLGDIHGVSLVDLNFDGWPDLFFSMGAERGRGLGVNRLYLNQSGQRFVRKMDLDALLEDAKGRGRSVCPTDVDGDGMTDLILMNHFQPGRPHHIALATPGNPPRYREGAAGTAFERAEAGAVMAVDLDGTGETEYVFLRDGSQAGGLYRRGHDGKFNDSSRPVGLKPGWDVRAVVPFDYDRDGDLDLFIARGSYLPEGAEIRERRVYFRFHAAPDREIKGFRTSLPEGSAEINFRFEGRRLPKWLHLGKDRVNPASLPLTLDLADPELKGDPGVDPAVDEGGFLWRDEEGMLVFSFVGVQGVIESAAGYVATSEAPPEALAVFGAPARRKHRNNLFRNDGGRFTDVADTARVLGEGLSSDALAADFDNDGDLDLYVVDGGLSFTNPPNQLYLNQGDGTFVEAADAAGAAGPTEGRGNSAVAFDYDLDGDLDLFLLNGAGPWPGNQGPLTLLRNDSVKQGASIQVDVRGGPINALGMGTRVMTRFDGHVLYQQRFCGNGHMATHILPFHIGLGGAKKVALTVTWPSGRQVSFTAAAGSRHMLEEPNGR